MVYQIVTGKHTIHEISNKNGEWVCAYAIANNMKIISTCYQNKRIHKWTWISPDGNTLNQIDYVMINANKKGVLEDVRTKWVLNCASDHFPVKTIIKQKLTRTKNNVVKQKKWNESNLQNPAKINQYTRKGRRFQTLELIQEESQAVLNTLRENDFQECFKKWQHRWDCCQASEGDYFEGDAGP